MHEMHVVMHVVMGEGLFHLNPLSLSEWPLQSPESVSLVEQSCPVNTSFNGNMNSWVLQAESGVCAENILNAALYT